MFFGAYKEFSQEQIKDYGIQIITGIEFDFVHNNKDFHLLGYGFDWKQLEKSDFINKKNDEEIMEEERKNLEFLKNVCRNQNIKIDENLDIKTPNDKASTLIKYNMMKFKENDKILDAMLGKNREKSFARGFVHNPNTPFFIDMTIGLPTAKEVADAIHQANGKVFLAHPFDYKDLDHKSYIQEIYNLGILDGIECVHTRHSLEQIKYIKQFCKSHNLKVSGGSDFHRDGKQKLGYGVNGSFPITDEYLFKNILEKECFDDGR